MGATVAPGGPFARMKEMLKTFIRVIQLGRNSRMNCEVGGEERKTRMKMERLL